MGKFNTSILIFKPKPISSLFKYVDAYEITLFRDFDIDEDRLIYFIKDGLGSFICKPKKEKTLRISVTEVFSRFDIYYEDILVNDFTYGELINIISRRERVKKINYILE